MNSQTIVMCVVALLLGMLLANMLKSVCGCKTIEGNGGVRCDRWNDPKFQIRNEAHRCKTNCADYIKYCPIGDVDADTRWTRDGRFDGHRTLCDGHAEACNSCLNTNQDGPKCSWDPDLNN